jgi:Domain of unknown function (DUF6457)
MDASTWFRAFVQAAGSETLTDAEVEAILELASLAAHASERMAAPLTCWAAASAGLSPAAAVELARSLAEAATEDP